MSAPDLPTEIAKLSLHDPKHFYIQHGQTAHRLQLLQHWDIQLGSDVIELGCGQGDCTTVLAHAVGEQGTVVAVDPAELSYGVLSHSLVTVINILTLSQALHTPLAKHKATSLKV